MEKVQVRDIRINRREVTRERPGMVQMDIPKKAKDGKGHHQARSEEKSHGTEGLLPWQESPPQTKTPYPFFLAPHLIRKIETLRSPGTCNGFWYLQIIPGR